MVKSTPPLNAAHPTIDHPAIDQVLRVTEPRS